MRTCWTPPSMARLAASSFRRSEEHTSELQSRLHLVCRLLLEKKKKNIQILIMKLVIRSNILILLHLHSPAHILHTHCSPLHVTIPYRLQWRVSTCQTHLSTQ